MEKNNEDQEQSRRVAKLISLATYNESIDKFSQSVTAFMEELHYLREARSAYEQAMAASAEIHKLLDSGDEKLLTLMCNLEQTIDFQLGRQMLEKKKPERLKVEPISGNGDGTDISEALA